MIVRDEDLVVLPAVRLNRITVSGGPTRWLANFGPDEESSAITRKGLGALCIIVRERMRLVRISW